MAAKRKDRVAPPAAPGEWTLRFHSVEAAEGWENLCKQAPGPTLRAWIAISKNPRDRSHPDRQHPLRGDLGRRDVGGVAMEQWQYEVTGGGRIWYVIDDGARTAWLTLAEAGHPRATGR